MTRRLEIDLYLPPEPLWPNARPHRALKWRQTRQYRTDCGLIALAAANACDWGLPAQVATLAATFHLDGRRRDPDNCLAAL
ncbi:MAG: hypothetical protein NT069_32445, partial [Planctomycetota bacterium]|nr:hypothetical protein [Planctomycetota bacterium]